MLHRLIERARIPDRENIIRILAARPTDPLFFDQTDRELDVHRNFDPGADDFSIALGGVSVSDMQQGSRHEYREVDRNAGDESALIHVAPMFSRGRRRYGFTLSRDDPHNTQHPTYHSPPIADLQF